MKTIVTLLLAWCYFTHTVIYCSEIKYFQIINCTHSTFSNKRNQSESIFYYHPTIERSIIGTSKVFNTTENTITEPEPELEPLENVLLTTSNDRIVGIFNTVAGGNTNPASMDGNDAGSYYPKESPEHAIDNNVWTKYNNQGNGPQSLSSPTKGVGTGFIVTPQYGLSIVTSFQFATGNDRPQRDPLTITLEGTNVTSDDQSIGKNWKLIYMGETGLKIDPGRSSFGKRQTLNNTMAAKSYRLIVTSQRLPEHSVQYSEAHLYGNVIRTDIVREYIVMNVQYDIANAVLFNSQKPTSVLEIDAINYMSTEQKMTKSRTIATTITNTWSFSYALTVGVKITISAGVPGFAEISIETSVEHTFETQYGQSISNEEAFTSELELIAPPRSKVRATLGLLDGQADIKFTSTLTTIYEDGRRLVQQGAPGLFRSVSVHKMIATYYEPTPIDIESNIG
ncbi:unnamed protein product [Rotaria sordida]|uniref:Uncharacterized protein n=1 Tax=Rotaria sordida TaxID=392033 RepID=A0A814VDD7_9BILA|nr:unnamed protein product [Rotaria sordida]